MNKFRTWILIFSLIVLLFPGSAFAAQDKAIVTVEVKDGIGADAVNLSNMYVVMYDVSVVGNDWWGKKAKVRKISAGKTTVKFIINPGQVVDFKAFETLADVYTNKKQPFYAPPQKNFSGELCFVAGIDFSKKMSDSFPCGNNVELIYSGSDVKVSVEVNDGVDYTKPLSSVAVGMYNVSIVNDEWIGELVKIKIIPVGKTQAVFSVTPGQIVDFLAFNNLGDAKKIKKHTFVVPPHKNFSGEYDADGAAMDGFCLIAGVDITKKLELFPGVNSCGNE
ncbi:MAG: hypothetical protein AAB953_03870, partial [Patescibacteria group bacterium]